MSSVKSAFSLEKELMNSIMKSRGRCPITCTATIRVSGMEDMYRDTVELFNKKIVSECDAIMAAILLKEFNFDGVMDMLNKLKKDTSGA